MKFSYPNLINTLSIIGLIALSSADAQQATIDTKLLEQFSLEQQVKGLKGYNARARQIIVPAGATIDKHEHSTRAGIVYVVSGEIIEYRHQGDKKRSRRLKVGETLIEDANTVHSYLNDTNEDCVLIAFDIPLQSL